MEKRNRKLLLAGAAVLALLAFSPHNRADIRILTHERGDNAPGQVQAAFDTGLIAVSVLITWTRRLAR